MGLGADEPGSLRDDTRQSAPPPDLRETIRIVPWAVVVSAPNSLEVSESGQTALTTCI